MTWDKQIAECADEMFPPPDTDHRLWPLLSHIRESGRTAYRAGATRQRILLRTDEAVEKVAQVLHDRMYDATAEITYPSGGAVPPNVVDEVRRRRWANAEGVARAALKALLGEA